MTVWYAVPLACWMDNVNMFRILSILYEQQVKNRADKSMCIWKIQILENATTKGSSLQETDFRCDFLFFENAQPEQMQLMYMTWTGDMIAVVYCKELTSVPENTIVTERSGPTLHLLAKQRGSVCSCLNWSRLTLVIRLISSYIQGILFWMLFDFPQTFCGFQYIVVSVFVVSDLLFGFPCILAVCSLVVHVMTSGTFVFKSSALKTLC